jgi:hypothetical protein
MAIVQTPTASFPSRCFILFEVEKSMPPFIYSLKSCEFSGGGITL